MRWSIAGTKHHMKFCIREDQALYDEFELIDDW